MKLIFLHGVGQDASSWNEVESYFTGTDCRSLDLFEMGILPSWQLMQDQVREAIRTADDQVVLVGLSLGAMLALSQLGEGHPNSAGVVAIAGQYQFKNNLAYKFQLALVKCLPSFIFAKQGIDKVNLLDFYKSLSNLDMTDSLRETDLPVLFLCGSKDKVNLSTTKRMAKLVSQSSFGVIDGAGHEVNRNCPQTLADAIQQFVQSLTT